MSIVALAQVGLSLVDKLVPDPNEKLKKQHEIKQMEVQGRTAELEQMVTMLAGQMEVNKVEAAHPSKWVAGWRPGVGWTCVVVLFVAYVPKAIVMTVLWAWQAAVMMNGCLDSTACDIATYTLPPFPPLGTAEILGLVGSMLGTATLRSFDKFKGTDTKGIS